MLEFNELIQETEKNILASREGVKVDFSGLREVCRRFNNRCVVEKVFECEGTDQQLWESVNTYFQRLLKRA